MATKELQTEFFRVLADSKSYQLLPPEEQARLRQSFEGATDEQLRSGIEELKRDTIEVARIEREQTTQQTAAADKAENIKKMLAEVEKSELKENIAEDTVQSQEDAEKLIESLEKIPPTKKRKKFLGIF